MTSLQLNLGELASFTLAGDPFQYLDTRGGFVEVPNHEQLNQERLVDSYGRDPADVTGGVIAEKMDMNGSGYGLYVGGTAASCDCNAARNDAMIQNMRPKAKSRSC